MDTKRLFLAAALSMAVLILWPLIFPPAERPEVGESPVSEAVGESELTPAFDGAERVADSAAETAVGGDRGDAAVATGDGRTPEAAVAAPVEEAEEVFAEREERVTVETESFRAEFSNRGARLVSFVLNEHPDSNGGLVDLVRRRTEGPYPFDLTDLSGRPDALNDALYSMERVRYDDGAERVSFEYAGPAGRASKDFVFEGGGPFRVTASVPGRDDWGVILGPGLRNPSEVEQASRYAGNSAVYNLAGEIERVATPRQKEAQTIPGGGLRWVGLQDTYFLTAWIPEAQQPVRQANLYPVGLQTDGEGMVTEAVRLGPEPSELVEGLPREQYLVVFPQGDQLVGHSYWGGKEFDNLSSLPFGLEGTVNLGFFAIIARPLLWGLRWIHDNVVGNYGWAIVLLTLIIRLLLFPLTHKGMVSMQKMQELNPKMQAIRQKYRPKLKDKQGRPNMESQRKMNEEIMGLYKAEGVSPAGGCLPMLLQLPVFFAFYQLLSSAIELRHEPWILWIKDLSAMDPYYVLPIFMGVAMFVQQKMTPSTADPMQRRMMMFMPFFITFICLKFPSGLALYWATSNVLGIVQQAFYTRMKKQAAMAAAGKRPDSKRGKRKVEK